MRTAFTGPEPAKPVPWDGDASKRCRWEKRHFDYALDNNVPDGVRAAAEQIVNSYGIHGMCDAGYICNVIGRHLGLGDGEGNWK